MRTQDNADQDPDEALMQRYRDGDTSAFERLYARHRGPLYRYFKRQCTHPAAAEELFQDVWMKVIRARDRYRVRARFATYLYRIAHNRLVDHYRSEAKSRDILAAHENPGGSHEIPQNPTADPERRLVTAERVARLQTLVQALPDKQREVFLLHEEGGLTLDDIANVLDVGRETAKSRLRYALAKLRRGLSEEP